ncbi:MAG: hypothetical protein GY913_21765 [Proteobacteria bacterium]|nr:hypothetical protein [Actinomycetes bacterium]MCP4919538.1 hypothetical protein [Pseudomonadota bacterium]
MPTEYDRHKLAENFIERYGRVHFRWLLEAFASGETNAEIGRELAEKVDRHTPFGREIVRRWRDHFGSTVTVFRPHQDFASEAGIAGVEHT